MYTFENIFENMRVMLVYAGRPDNQTINTDGVDMSGFEGVAFVVGIEPGEAITCTLRAQQDNVSNFAAAADLAGSSITVSPTATARGSGVLDICRPRKRYVRAVLTVGDFVTPRGATVVAIQYGARRAPVVITQLTAAELHVSPAEGTA